MGQSECTKNRQELVGPVSHVRISEPTHLVLNADLDHFATTDPVETKMYAFRFLIGFLFSVFLSIFPAEFTSLSRGVLINVDFLT